MLAELRELISYLAQNEQQLVHHVMDRSTKAQQREISGMKKTLEKKLARLHEIDSVIKRLYEDNVIGRISNDRFEKLIYDFENEQNGLMNATNTLERQISGLEQEIVNVDRFIGVVRRYTQIAELTPTIVHEFIDRIIVYDPEQARGNNRRQKVEIIYKSVGALDFHHMS